MFWKNSHTLFTATREPCQRRDGDSLDKLWVQNREGKAVLQILPGPPHLSWQEDTDVGGAEQMPVPKPMYFAPCPQPGRQRDRHAAPHPASSSPGPSSASPPIRMQEHGVTTILWPKSANQALFQPLYLVIWCSRPCWYSIHYKQVYANPTQTPKTTNLLPTLPPISSGSGEIKMEVVLFRLQK